MGPRMKNDDIKDEIRALARKAHDLTDTAYREHPASRGEPAWADKQRVLLADMALHLVQTALKEGELSADDLRRNLYSILTISDQFIPAHGLKANADQLLAT